MASQPACGGDSDAILLRKIAIAFGASGVNAPRPGDTKNLLLQKILRTIAGC